MSGVSAEAFAAMMAELMPAMRRADSPLPAAMAIAVSGGADSMTLAVLAAQWAGTHGITLHALTVDHRLRKESTREAQQVGEWMQRLHLPHHILTWEHDQPPSRNTHAAARNARYGLMAEWAAARGIHHVLVAHHLDDQAETLLLRLQRGSGVDGLSAMQPVSRHHGMTLLRPLLNTPKSTLKDTLHQHGQDWVEDPSNQRNDAARNRMRHAMAALELDATTLAQTATHMRRARDYLERQTAEAANTLLHADSMGFLTLEMQGFAALHEEIALRLLADTLRRMNGTVYRPRFHELQGLYTALPDTRTLAGCVFSQQKDGLLRIEREAAATAAPQPVQPNEHGVWDGRFHYRIGATCPKDATIAALGAKGLAMLSPADYATPAGTVPKRILHSLPTLWHLETPVCVPHIGYGRQEWLTAHGFADPNGS